MAIDFETEEKSRRWLYILPVAILVIALALTVWAYANKKIEINDLRTEHSLTTLEMKKYKKLYVDLTTISRRSQSVVHKAEMSLDECRQSLTQIQDQNSEMQLLLSSDIINAQ